MEDFGTIVRRYLAAKGREFTEEVKRKQARQLAVAVAGGRSQVAESSLPPTAELTRGGAALSTPEAGGRSPEGVGLTGMSGDDPHNVELRGEQG
jgi:hypothetical protein